MFDCLIWPLGSLEFSQYIIPNAPKAVLVIEPDKYYHLRGHSTTTWTKFYPF